MATNHQTATGNYQNLFVAKLPLSVTNSELMTVFAPFSPSSATVMLDPVSGRSKGYAFVLFAAEADGRSAASALDKQVATVTRCDTPFSFDLTIFASKHSGREVAAENECLYIRNIPNSWPMARVDAFIAEHGKPVYSAVRSDHLGSPVWVVFVEYDSVESARKTLKAVHGMVVAPRSPPILAKYAESDDVKRNRKDRKTGRPELEANTKATSSHKPTNRRIDVAHQMHHPCHATRYDESGSRVNAPQKQQQQKQQQLPVASPPPPAPMIVVGAATPLQTPFAPPMNAFTPRHGEDVHDRRAPPMHTVQPMAYALSSPTAQPPQLAARLPSFHEHMSMAAPTFATSPTHGKQIHYQSEQPHPMQPQQLHQHYLHHQPLLNQEHHTVSHHLEIHSMNESLIAPMQKSNSFETHPFAVVGGAAAVHSNSFGLSNSAIHQHNHMPSYESQQHLSHIQPVSGTSACPSEHERSASTVLLHGSCDDEDAFACTPMSAFQRPAQTYHYGEEADQQSSGSEGHFVVKAQGGRRCPAIGRYRHNPYSCNNSIVMLNC